MRGQIELSCILHYLQALQKFLEVRIIRIRGIRDESQGMANLSLGFGLEGNPRLGKDADHADVKSN